MADGKVTDAQQRHRRDRLGHTRIGEPRVVPVPTTVATTAATTTGAASSRPWRNPSRDPERLLSSAPDLGETIVHSALHEPLRQLAFNAGYDEKIVVDRVRALEGTYGFNAIKGEYVDLMSVGIIDPAKVVRVALSSAADMVERFLATI